MSRFEVLRGALDPDWMTRFEQSCREWFSSIERRLSDPREIAAYPLLSGIAKQSGIPLSLHHDQTKPPDGIEVFFDVVSKAPVWNKIAAGRQLYLLRDYCSVRRQRPDEDKKALAWHQDSAVVTGTSRGIGISGYVAWVPITPIDAETPTLQIIPDWSAPLEHQFSKETGYLESTFMPTGEILTVKDLTRGDILLFDLDCPHRTHVAPGMTKDRLSIDVRLVRQRPLNYRGQMIPLVDGAGFTDLRRNDPCPCGSGKRYKHCHGAIA